MLGLGYNLAEDQLNLTFPLQYCRKGRQRQKEVAHLDRKELEQIRQGSRSFSRREALSLVMGVFDPLGLVSPALLQGKLLLRRLYGPEHLHWVTVLPAKEKEAWVSWLEELLQETEIHMERTVRPAGAVGGPVIAGFSDASISAMCATIYVVWQMRETPPVSRLLLAKVRVTPVSSFSVPRAELQAVVIMMRLLMVTLQAAAFKASRVVLATDSACCVAALKKAGVSMNAFFANQVSEVRHTLAEARELAEEVEDIRFIEGKQNPADWGTRPGIRLEELGLGSTWQTGPSFLQNPRESWPLKNSVQGDIPREELRTRHLQGVVLAAAAAPPGQDEEPEA